MHKSTYMKYETNKLIIKKKPVAEVENPFDSFLG